MYKCVVTIISKIRHEDRHITNMIMCTHNVHASSTKVDLGHVSILCVVGLKGKPCSILYRHVENVQSHYLFLILCIDFRTYLT